MFKTRSLFAVVGFCLAMTLALAGCKGGGGGGGGGGLYRVDVTVSGLAGAGLTLRSGPGPGADLVVTADGTYTVGEFASGADYDVSVAQQPTSPWQTCTVANGAGAVGNAHVSVQIACVTNTYGIGGTVSGLLGSGLVLQNAAGDDLAVGADGAFVFGTRPASGSIYAVTVKTQPTTPAQTCTVTDGTGTVAGADVTNVVVQCATSNFALRGTVSGLTSAGLVLHSDVGAGEDLVLPANATSFAFAGRVASGASYTVTVKTQPAGRTCGVSSGAGVMGVEDVTNIAVTCSSASFTIGGTVSGLTAAGLQLRNTAGSQTLAVASGATTFTFPSPSPTGTPYAVTVLTQPAGLTCGVTNGTGTVGAANVTHVSVSCARTYGIGGTVAGLTIGGLVLHNSLGNQDLSVAANATAFTFANRASTGQTYAVTVKTQPSLNITCTVANGTGTIGTGDVTDIAVSCTSAIAVWTAPARWGGVWQDSPTMVQHAHVDASGLVSDKGPTFNFVGGTPPAPLAVSGFPGVGTRHAVGPFTTEAANYQATNAQALDLAGDMIVCAVITPAKNRPFDSYEHPIISKSLGDGTNSLDNAGWSLMEMHDHWCFHYQYNDGAGNTHQFMSAVPAFFANEDFQRVLTPAQPWPADLGRPNPTVIVVCGGRSGDQVVVAANTWDPSSGALFSLTRTQDQLAPNPFAGPYTLDGSGTMPATIGGYHLTSAQMAALYPEIAADPLADAFKSHLFDGLIYETAVWNEPATPANVQAKMGAFFGLPQGTTYLRNREAHYLDAGGTLRTAGRHAPRLVADKGFVFGLQGWNRVNYWMEGNADYRQPMIFPAGEHLALWTKTPAIGADVPSITNVATVAPPNGSRNAGERVTLPPGAALSIQLDQAVTAPGTPNPTPHTRRPTWDSSGPIQGQLWLRATTAGTLRIQKTAPAAGNGTSCTVLGASAPCEQRDVNLATLTANEWNRVSLNGAFTADATQVDGVTTNKGTLVLTNPGSSAITFFAWGVQLTQLGGGANLGTFDPAELMYDWSPSRMRDGEPNDDPIYPIDVLKISPPTSTSTATTGFCLAVEASMPTGLNWAAPFPKARTAATWVNNLAAPTTTLTLQVRGATGPNAGHLCVDITGAPSVCAPVPAAFNDGNKHLIKTCVSASGNVRLYADSSATPLASGAGPENVPNMNTGVLLVGNSDVNPVNTLTPWNGFISRVAVCRDTGTGADCR